MRNLFLMKTRFLILFLLTLTSWTTQGQVTDSVKLKTWNKRIERSEKLKRHRDSLETIFNSVPPFYKITLELNHQQTTIPDGARFYATNGQQTYESKKTEDDKFMFDNLPDSVKFGLQFDSIKLETGFVKSKFFKNGAGLRFGYYDNILELKQKWDKGKKDEDFDEWTEIGDPYLTAIKDKKLIRAAKKGQIRPIEFVSVSPRTFGDGVIHTYQNVRLK
ncbi:MAG: hypothetical protein QY309_13310 [Cyclobacteriaceae bacterium]|nr:MAG: hypothetical protein QY309_13310 [Cyclobacteriaceae bacterium]